MIIKYLPDETKLLLLRPVKLIMYRWIFGSFYWTKIVEITNKRLIISMQYFGYESKSSGLSFWYKESDYQKHKRFGDSFILTYEVSKGLFGDRIKIVTKQGFMKLNTKIYTSKCKDVERIIKKHHVK
jgi:hypothetical protein